MRRLFPFVFLVTVTWLGAADTPPAKKPDSAAPSTDELYDAGKALFDEYAPPEIKEQYEFPSRESFDAFATRLQEALDGNDVSQLATYEPEARAALTALGVRPG